MKGLFLLDYSGRFQVFQGLDVFDVFLDLSKGTERRGICRYEVHKENLGLNIDSICDLFSFAYLERFGLTFSSWSFVIRVNP